MFFAHIFITNAKVSLVIAVIIELELHVFYSYLQMYSRDNNTLKLVRFSNWRVLLYSGMYVSVLDCRRLNDSWLFFE